MTHHRQEVDVGDDLNPDRKNTLSDDWLSKDELMERRAIEARKRELMNFNEPPPKAKIDRDNAKFPTVTTAAETESAPENAETVPDPESVPLVQRVHTSLKDPSHHSD